MFGAAYRVDPNKSVTQIAHSSAVVNILLHFERSITATENWLPYGFLELIQIEDSSL